MKIHLNVYYSQINGQCVQDKLNLVVGADFRVVHRLRLRAVNAGAWVQPLVRELDPTCLN